MQKYIINGRFLTQRVTGVQRYAREIIMQLDSFVEKGMFELAIPIGTSEQLNLHNINTVFVGKNKGILWEHLDFPIYVNKKNAIAVNFCNTAPFSSPGVVAIFDMKIREHPDFFSKRFILWYWILFANETRRAKLIFTDSYSAKSDILRFYQIAEDKIVVVPCAWQHYDRILYNEGTLQKYNLLKGEYYFAIGSLDPNKNFKWIAEHAKRNPGIVFAVAGAINQNVFSNNLGFECPSNMKLLGYVSDEEAKTLMRDCRAFLFPSFCEGFGMPPLEAISAGAKSIIVSDIPVMHELFENAARFISPYTYEGDFEKVVEITETDRKAILGKYSWFESAKIVYQTLLRLQ